MAYGVPFQLPPSQQSVSALMQRLSGARPMATGGSTKAVQTPATAPAPAVTPYVGDITQYGAGPEHLFFQNTAPPKPPAGGGSSGGGGGGSGTGGGTMPATVNSDGTFGVTTANKDGTTSTTTMAAPGTYRAGMYQLMTGNYLPTPGDTTSAPAAAAQPDFAQQTAQKLGLTQPAPVSGPTLTTPAAQPSNPLTSYLSNLSGLQQIQPQVLLPQTAARPSFGGGAPRNMATGGSTDEDPTDVVAAPQKNVEQMQRRGEQAAGGPGQNISGQDRANADVAVTPSLKSALGIGSMVAGLATGPVAGLIGAAAKMGMNALLGSGPMSSPFDVPGPRLSPDVLSTAAQNYDQAIGMSPRVLTKALPGYASEIAGDRAAAQQGPGTPLGGYGMTTPALGGYGQAEITGNFTSPGFSGAPSGGPSTPGGGDRAGDGYGGQGGDIGSGRGDYGGSGEPDKGGLYARGGAARKPMRFPAVRRFAEGGSGSDETGIRALHLTPQEQALVDRHLGNLATGRSVANSDGSTSTLRQITAEIDGRTYNIPTVWDGQLLDPDIAVQRAKAIGLQNFPSYATEQQAQSRYNQMHDYMDQDVRGANRAPYRCGGRARFADGGSSSGNAASAPGDDQDQPTDSSGISSQWLPLLAGAYSASQGDPAAGAASVGVASAMLGQSPQQAMDSARLLYRSGASQQPQAQQRNFDPGRSATNSLLAQLAMQSGLSNKLALSAQDPSGAMNQQAAPMPYQKPTARTASNATQAAAGGAMHRGPGPVSGDGDGQEDMIPAQLSDGEYVVDAGTVSALGNGSNKAGARHLDNLRQAVRGRAAWKNPKKIQPRVNVGAVIKKMSGGRP